MRKRLLLIILVIVLSACQAKPDLSNNIGAEPTESNHTETQSNDTVGETAYQTKEQKGEEVVEPVNFRKQALNGASIEIDPNWPYYQNRSVQSIADEIQLAGYKTVYYCLVNENFVNGDLINAFHDRGIAVWLLVFGNGSYSTQNFPDGWQKWQMELVEPSDVAGFVFLSQFSKEYVDWKKKSLARLVKEYPFDGVAILESFFPEWDGLVTKVYGDIGPNAQEAFREKYGTEIPDFKDPSAPNYYANNRTLYEQWIEFRVNGVNDFLDEIFNGEGGVREANPDILVGTWSLGIDAGPSSVEKLREYQGLDAAAMVQQVKPDIHFFQTHWPDWIKPESELPADYMKAYKPFYDQVREAAPELPIGLQADNGSVESMIKSTKWQQQLNIEAQRHGYAAWTTYEYHIGGYIYNEKPVPMRAQRQEDGTVIISFNKRIDDSSGEKLENYSVFQNGELLDAGITKAQVDGNRVILTAEAFPIDSFEISVRGVKDTPKLWLYKNYPANEVPEGSKIQVK